MVQYPAAVAGVTFAALGDSTRLGILESLWRDDASISELASRFGMTLTGIAKHVHVLEGARLVTTEKVGRVRHCRLGPRRLDEEAAWLARYRQMVEERYDALAEFLDRTKGDAT
jgi:DNA-binding transcriptional ArsR family regulator